jgi:lysophospholipase L1-like esterase
VTRILGIVVLVVLSAGLTACYQETENGKWSTDDSPRSRTMHQATTDEPVAEADTEATPPDAPAWDYVALGDSLAAGVGARRGYVDRYAEYLRDDTGVRVEVVNLGVSGQTSPQLLRILRNDPSTRRALRGAEVVTYNIGINDLGQARASYEAGTCGGVQGERCLRMAVKEFEANWDAITKEILDLRSPDEAIIHTAGLGYTPRVGKTFQPYLKQANRHIAASAAENGIPYAKASLGDEDLGPDGLHPDNSGYQAITNQLQKPGK